MRCATTHHHQLASAVSVSSVTSIRIEVTSNRTEEFPKQHQQIASFADRKAVKENSGETSRACADGFARNRLSSRAYSNAYWARSRLARSGNACSAMYVLK
jgi:hypothetical protein